MRESGGVSGTISSSSGETLDNETAGVLTGREMGAEEEIMRQPFRDAAKSHPLKSCRRGYQTTLQSLPDLRTQGEGICGTEWGLVVPDFYNW